MTALRRLLLIAFCAGLAGAVVASAVQTARLWPLILHAESFEAAAPAAPASAAAPHVHEAWAPADGAQRIAFTMLFNLLAGVAFALLLNGAMALRHRDGAVPLALSDGVAWGLAGFASFALAPALGLPPELPGMHAADLGARQLWWIATVVATAGGLALAAFAPARLLQGAGLLLIAAPHVIGAPRADQPGPVPGELAAEFAAASLVGACLVWLTIGVVSVLAQRRFAARPLGAT